MDMDGAEEWYGEVTGGSGVRRSWIGDDGDIIMAGGGCGGRIGKGGTESAPGDFEEEGVAVEENGWGHWKEGQKSGGGAHQGQSGWSKTTGATNLLRFFEVNWVRLHMGLRSCSMACDMRMG
ncbi:hypothetical protein BY996DRAFT_8688939 [Phakopsora pachyrhizi]|nr:hypothetical protein BY996DRAFT_8688939 [Phakopsora pachyrhizi]